MNAKKLTAGTRVTTTIGKYAGQVGTVQEGNHGTVTNTEHENYGRAFVSVRWDPTPQIPWGETFRPFVDELTVVETSDAGRLSLEDALEYADQMRRDTTCVGLPNWPTLVQIAPATCVHGKTPRHDVTGNPIAACTLGDGGTEWGAFNAEGCTYRYDCAVDVANEAAKENEEAEATLDDPESTWGEACREHDGQPKNGCEDCNDEPECEGHYDDDNSLMTAGIGEATYCDGSCNPRR